MKERLIDCEFHHTKIDITKADCYNFFAFQCNSLKFFALFVEEHMYRHKYILYKHAYHKNRNFSYNLRNNTTHFLACCGQKTTTTEQKTG